MSPRQSEIIQQALARVMQAVTKEVALFNEILPDDPKLKAEMFDNLVFNVCSGLISSSSSFVDQDSRMLYIYNICTAIRKVSYELSLDNEEIENIIKKMTEAEYENDT